MARAGARADSWCQSKLGQRKENPKTENRWALPRTTESGIKVHLPFMVKRIERWMLAEPFRRSEDSQDVWGQQQHKPDPI
jgi:hypothetical protein